MIRTPDGRSVGATIYPRRRRRRRLLGRRHPPAHRIGIRSYHLVVIVIVVAILSWALPSSSLIPILCLPLRRG